MTDRTPAGRPEPLDDALPTGTVTFLFTDIAGSTRLLRAHPHDYADLLHEHRRLLRAAFVPHGGHEVDTQGDSFFVAFPTAAQALSAAAQAQRSLSGHDWPGDEPLRVRMGLHTGAVTVADGSYIGLEVHRAARIAAAGAGGQVLLSQATADLIGEEMPAGVSLHSIGDNVLKDFPEPAPLYQLDIVGLPGRFPAPPTTLTRRPPRLDSFVGRGRELEEVTALVSTSRLVTLTGPGGSGKTRLAEEVAADLEATGTSTVVVELASVEDGALIPGAVAAQLDLGPAETVEALVTRLADRQLLLVLDNVEQIRGAAGVIAGLLHGTTAVRVLATSREPLHVSGERAYPVRPLPVPGADERDPDRLAATPSVVLLLDRAQEQRSTMASSDAEALRDVVRTLDGLPLALEIAAPWVHALGPSSVLAELSHALDLGSRSVDTHQRHRTLRSTIAWSHDRLTPPERRLLRRMSVLRGGGDVDAVRAVGGGDLGSPVLDVLVDLIDRNLVQRAESVAGMQRLRLLETVRQFSAERLDDVGERPATDLRAAEHFAAWAVGLIGHAEGAAAESWLARAVADADNLRAAMEELDRLGRAEEHLQLVVDTVALWYGAGLEGEGERRLQRALEMAPEDAAARPVGLAFLNLFVGVHDTHAGVALLNRAVALARIRGDDEALALALSMLGEVAPDQQVARSANEETFRLANRLRGRPIRYAMADPDSLACVATGNLASHARYRAVSSAIDWQRRTIQYAERKADRRTLAWMLAELSYMQMLGGDVSSAAAALEKAKTLVTEDASGRYADNIALAAALLLEHLGRAPAAEQAAREIISSGLADGRLLHVHFASCFLADFLLTRGELAECDALLRRAEDLLPDSPDLRHLTRVRARRARWLRLAGRPDEASAVREETEKGLEPGELSPEHIVWLVESALAAGTDAERATWEERLDELSRHTGVCVPPWERALLARS